MTYRELFAVPEFRTVFAAAAVSLLGDWLARVALVVLVYDRTGSAAASALAFAATLLPFAIGGPLLSGLADRLPRRTLLVRCDLWRAATVGLVVVPWLPWPVLLALVFAAELATPPAHAARVGTLAEVLPGDRLVGGSAAMQLLIQSSQFLGLAAGGLVVGGLGARPSLLLDAATFLASAVVLRLGLQLRPAARDDGHRCGPLVQLREGLHVATATPLLRGLTALGWLSALAIVPEGLAASLADATGGGSRATGLILAANPCGAALGAVLMGRFVPPDRRRGLMVPLAAVSLVPLVGLAGTPPLPVVLALLAVSGMAMSYNLPAAASFIATVPDHARGQAFGLVNAGMLVLQGLAILVSGGLAELAGPGPVSAAAGALGVGLAVAVGLTWLRAPQPQPVPLAEVAVAPTEVPVPPQVVDLTAVGSVLPEAGPAGVAPDRVAPDRVAAGVGPP